MNLQTDPLGDPLTICLIRTDWNIAMKVHRICQYGCSDDLDRQDWHNSVSTWVRSHSNSPEPLLTLLIRKLLSSTQVCCCLYWIWYHEALCIEILLLQRTNTISIHSYRHQQQQLVYQTATQYHWRVNFKQWSIFYLNTKCSLYISELIINYYSIIYFPSINCRS